MTIWRYDAISRESPAVGDSRTCVYCGSPLVLWEYDRELLIHSGAYTESDLNQSRVPPRGNVGVCKVCGWWRLMAAVEDRSYGECCSRVWGAGGALKKLDLTDVSTPIEEVSRYLVVRYSDRYKVHPRKYEEVVASVFCQVGYEVRLTSYSGDDGVDVVVLDGPLGDVIGVQAKRYEGKIEAGQIREFAGALLLNGMTKGVFVTTSSYTRGAAGTARRFANRNVSIDLWDAERFYSALKLNRRQPYKGILDSDAPYGGLVRDISKLPLISESWLPTP